VGLPPQRPDDWLPRGFREFCGGLLVIMEEHGSGRSVVAPSFTDGLV